ncbi:sulfite exporter TauE/SafE family protein, partial [Alphaproteobacteria bacterium]|nr:sulfite exporter TauE/SafE family protein [Alphaproteobacteria bacterium]
MIEQALISLRLINELEVLIPISLLAVLLVAISKSGFGGALGSLGLPVMVLVFPPKLAIAILLPLYLITDFFVAFTWRKFSVFRILKVMVLGGLIGQILGWLCFEYLNDSYILALIGLLALITSIRYLKNIFFRNYLSYQTKKILQLSYIRAIGWCGFSGFSSFVALTGGIPAQIFLLPLGLERQLFVGTMSLYFLIINLAKLPFFLNLEVFSHTSILLSIIVLPILPIGIY